MNKYEMDVYNLLENSLEFELLNNKLNRFNPFKVLRIDKFEIRHSNFLAWLLDPTQNHKLGNSFMKKFLAKIILKEENKILLEKYNIDLLKIKESSFEDLIVLREVSTSSERKIDLLSISENMKLVLLIENKYKSGESEGQLDDYLNYIKAKYSGFTVIPIFLSLYGVEPTNNNYLIMDYSDILNILNDLIKLNEEFINKNINDFIKYYIDILESELVKDEEDINLAFEIYKLNKDAIDLLVISNRRKKCLTKKFINKNLKDYYHSLNNNNKDNYFKIYLKYKETIDFISNIGNNTMTGAFLKFASDNSLPRNCYNAHIRVPSFILPKFLILNDVLGTPRQNYWLNNAFIIFFERLGDNRLRLIIEIGPIEYEKRLILLNKLEENNLKIKSKSKEADSVYTRVSISFIEVEDWTDIDEIYEAMNSLYHEEGVQDVLLIIDNTINELKNNVIEVDNNKIIEETFSDDIKLKENKLKKAFLEFAVQYNLLQENYNLDTKCPSFILEEFRVFDKEFGLPRWKWWLNNAVILFFESLKDNRLKLTIEIGPLEHSNRIILLNKLEEKGVRIKEKSKLPDACYTRIFTDTKSVANWDDKDEILKVMNDIYNSENCKKVINNIIKIANEIQ